ncbi:hypothetical protein ACJ41O_008928 [Fusarium nematophilum]
MVSFFGLKLGGDRKKSHDKNKPASKPIQHLPRDQDLTARDLDFASPKNRRRLTNSSNFSRPNFAARPDTSSSNRDLSAQWRAPYMNGGAGGAGGASSMVDLGAPRAPGMGNPRFHASDANLNMRFANGSATSLVAPGPIRDGANRPGTATSRKEFDNPFQVHFGGKESISSTRPGTPLDAETFERFEFGLGDDSSRENRDVGSSSNNPATNGYPSPPPSIVNAERPFSPSSQDNNRPSSNRRNAPFPSGLRNVDTASGPMALPSPAASVARSSEDVWETPVIRNVQAKRDTLTFHTPRRQSFAMEVDEVRAREGSKPMVEGFAGNFSGFDFGETVRRGSVGNRSLEGEGGVSPTDVKPRAFGTARTASPLRTMQSSPSLSLSETGSTRARNTSDATSPLSTVSTAEDTPRGQSPQLLQPSKGLQPVQSLQVSRPLSPSRSPQPSPLSQPPQLQQVSPQPSPTFPTKEKDHSTIPQQLHQPSSQLQPSSQVPPSSQLQPPQHLQHPQSPNHPPKQYLPYQPPQHDPPSRPLPTKPTSPIPIPPPTQKPTSSIPHPPRQMNPRPNNPPAAAVGAHPGYMSRPLDPPPPPRGFSRPRTDSDPRSRRPLRVPAPLVDRTVAFSSSTGEGAPPRSPYGPPVDGGNYMRPEASPRPAPDPPRTHSPLARPPIEGDFPVSKGLPRGRKPPGMDHQQQTATTNPDRSFGLGPRRQHRQRPMYPPPRAAAPSPTPELKSRESEEGPPNWNDFDRPDPHRSAIPPPLSPFRADFRAESSLRSPAQATDESTSPRRMQYTSSPISPTPPSLPSPSFPSLQNSISGSSETLARSFDMAADGNYSDGNQPEAPPPPQNTNHNHHHHHQPQRPLISPVMVDFVPSRDNASPGATRVEARKAPPRPSPIVPVPASLGVGPESARVRTPNPVVDQFNPGFI